jgi:hypothetical protein
VKGKPFHRLFGILKTVAPTLLAASGSPLAPLAIGIAKKAMGDGAMTDAKLEDAVSVRLAQHRAREKFRQIEADLAQS